MDTTRVEEKIINATIDCIDLYGISGATNRHIAQVAGVNLAAINYYFRTKEALIQRVMEITLKNAFDLSDITPTPGESASERCIAILMHIIQGGLRYPGITVRISTVCWWRVTPIRSWSSTSTASSPTCQPTW
jgi:TetR/AcrR family transcriptional regulator, regulator of cefoperazone and chloramphenicol sensitivity